MTVRLSLLFFSALLVTVAGALYAQVPDDRLSALTLEHHHDGHGAHGHVAVSGWEGSVAGKAYSEFNHHLAGILVIAMGVAELRSALGLTAFAWARFLLPVAMLMAGGFLLIWSDHEAWPIGSLTLAQTILGGDWEILQHKLFGVVAVAVGAVELWRRQGGFRHPLWRAPLPVMAIIGGLSLFLHSHGVHPAAHEIALHHAAMGALAVTAGSSKLASTWRSAGGWASRWELLWSCLVILIGIQLLLYSE